MRVKACKACGRVLMSPAFRRDVSSPDGLTAVCQRCVLAGKKPTASASPPAGPEPRNDTFTDIPLPRSRTLRVKLAKEAKRVVLSTGTVMADGSMEPDRVLGVPLEAVPGLRTALDRYSR